MPDRPTARPSPGAGSTAAAAGGRVGGVHRSPGGGVDDRSAALASTEFESHRSGSGGAATLVGMLFVAVALIPSGAPTPLQERWSTGDQ